MRLNAARSDSCCIGVFLRDSPMSIVFEVIDQLPPGLKELWLMPARTFKART
jgi:hypothetical protein